MVQSDSTPQFFYVCVANQKVGKSQRIPRYRQQQYWLLLTELILLALTFCPSMCVGIRNDSTSSGITGVTPSSTEMTPQVTSTEVSVISVPSFMEPLSLNFTIVCPLPIFGLQQQGNSSKDSNPSSTISVPTHDTEGTTKSVTTSAHSLPFPSQHQNATFSNNNHKNETFASTFPSNSTTRNATAHHDNPSIALPTLPPNITWDVSNKDVIKLRNWTYCTVTGWIELLTTSSTATWPPFSTNHSTSGQDPLHQPLTTATSSFSKLSSSSSDKSSEGGNDNRHQTFHITNLNCKGYDNITDTHNISCVLDEEYRIVNCSSLLSIPLVFINNMDVTVGNYTSLSCPLLTYDDPVFPPPPSPSPPPRIHRNVLLILPRISKPSNLNANKNDSSTNHGLLPSLNPEISQAARLFQLRSHFLNDIHLPCGAVPSMSTQIVQGIPSAEVLDEVDDVVLFTSSLPSSMFDTIAISNTLDKQNKSFYWFDDHIWNHNSALFWSSPTPTPRLKQFARILFDIVNRLQFKRIILVIESETVFIQDEFLKFVAATRSFNVSHTIMAEISDSQIENSISEYVFCSK